MSYIKIYNKEEKIVFNKNKHLCSIYKYNYDSEIIYYFNLKETYSKFHSLFDCFYKDKYLEINLSLTSEYINYEIKYKNKDQKIREFETGRLSLKMGKKNWSKKTLLVDSENIEVELFDKNRSVIYKVKDDFFNNLLKLNKNDKRK